MVQSAREQYFGSIESELNRERANVLGRYGRRVEGAIARCQALLEAIDEEDPTSIMAFKDARRVALQAVEDLCFQREMLRLYDNARVDEIYAVPPPLSNRRAPSIASGSVPPSE